MGLALVATTKPDLLSSLTRSDLSRLEGLGDNCELGFVLRRLGFEDGMLFRWASIRPECLLATLRGDFVDLYEFDNLVPQNPKMVRDLHYGTCWHTQMYSSLHEGTLAFNDSAEVRRAIHAKEAAKLAYLVTKLQKTFNKPNPVFVIKANAGIADDLLEHILFQLYRRTVSSRFLLLEVRDDPRRAGTTEMLDRNWMRGYVPKFAGYDSADEGDDAHWIPVLRRALAHNAEPSPATVATVSSGAVVLPFPTTGQLDLRMPVIGDIRGGIVSRIGGNTWCRMMDQDTYRLHATGFGANATALQWTGVQLPPDFVMTTRAGCAIVESLPVMATLTVTGADGSKVQKQHLFVGIDEQELSVAIPQHLPNPLTVSLRVEPVSALKSGQAAVIDLCPIQAKPV